jgi:DNA-binding protein HU-beta
MAKGLTKSEFIASVAQKSNMDKKQAVAVLNAVSEVIVEQLKATGEVTLPGMLKMKVRVRPATPEREGLHPITKVPTIFKAKPERRVVKASPVKALKDAVAI